MTDLVNHPPHYKTAAGIEAIDVIENYGFGSSFHLGNALKYLLRAGRKGDRLADLEKADWYLRRVTSRSLFGEWAESAVAYNWNRPAEIVAAFEITGAQAAAVTHLLDLVRTTGRHAAERREIQFGMARIALGIAIVEEFPPIGVALAVSEAAE